MRSKFHRVALVAACLALPAGTGAETHSSVHAGITVGPSVWISSDRPRAPDVESFLALDPADPKKLLATAISYEKGQSIPVVYLSQDGGRSWSRVTASTGVPQFAGGDPIVYYDDAGVAFFGGIDTRFQVWRSRDGGSQWNSVAVVPGGNYDRQYLGIDESSGPYRGRMYADGTVTVRKRLGGYYPMLGIAHSDDDGHSFDPATIVDATFDNGEAGGFGGSGDLLVTSQGTLIVPFLSTAGLKPSLPRGFWVFVSSNGGRTFTAREGLAFDWGPRRTMRSAATSTNIRAAIDTSRAHKDRIYVTYKNVVGGRYDVDVTHSDDLGASWSAPVQVNDNTGQDDVSNIAIAVNRNGLVALVWNDRRDDPTDRCFRLYGSASLDGGDTFLPNVEIGARPACPGTAANWSGSINSFPIDGTITFSSLSDRFTNGGETQGLVAGPDGRFHVTWSSDVSDVTQLWYTSFTVAGAVAPTSAQPAATVTPVQTAGDITSEVSLETHSPEIDFAAKSISVEVRVKNLSPTPLTGPITLVWSGVDTDFGDLTAANAGNGMHGIGAAWEVLPHGEALLPGAESRALTVRWNFDGRAPLPEHLLSQFVAQFKVMR